MTAYEFIISEIDKTTKISDTTDETLIPLPYPFTAPCAEKTFQEMYYWDTYFTNKALLLTGRDSQAANNVKNLIYLLNRYGKIPNGNRLHYLGRSQPPFLGLMLKDLLERGGISLTEAYAALKKEYSFWQTERSTESGLNAYGSDLTDEEYLGNTGVYNEIHTEKYTERTGIFIENTMQNAKHVIAEYESGWDFTPRFYAGCADFNAVDLNSLLYADEKLLSRWAELSGERTESEYFSHKAKARKERIVKYCFKNGVYYDYDFINGKVSAIVSCASLFPFFVGADDDKNAFLRVLSQLEREHGVVAAKTESRNFQWAEPNGWAPLNYIAVKAADRLNLKADAARLTEKYLSATDGIFAKTGRLWEKYNAITGDMCVSSEYGTPEMLGWSAGVYVALYEYEKSGYRELI
ncbi:MAG: alpha,alpha-trehalase [Clostridia bacterium]|nr:alpha,alpha-trehalase [Clostridia bacterium]